MCVSSFKQVCIHTSCITYIINLFRYIKYKLICIFLWRKGWTRPAQTNSSTLFNVYSALHTTKSVLFGCHSWCNVRKHIQSTQIMYIVYYVFVCFELCVSQFYAFGKSYLYVYLTLTKSHIFLQGRYSKYILKQKLIINNFWCKDDPPIVWNFTCVKFQCVKCTLPRNCTPVCSRRLLRIIYNTYIIRSKYTHIKLYYNPCFGIVNQAYNIRKSYLLPAFQQVKTWPKWYTQL